MTPNEITRIIEGTVVFAGICAIFYAVFKNTTVKQTIANQKDLIELLTSQVNELRTLHLENEKAISKLSGQIEVYKEIPLKDIATSLQQISTNQRKILEVTTTKGAINGN